MRPTSLRSCYSHCSGSEEVLSLPREIPGIPDFEEAIGEGMLSMLINCLSSQRRLKDFHVVLPHLLQACLVDGLKAQSWHGAMGQPCWDGHFS